MVELPSPQSFKLASLYSLKDLGLEAGASTIWQDINSILRLCLWGAHG